MQNPFGSYSRKPRACKRSAPSEPPPEPPQKRMTRAMTLAEMRKNNMTPAPIPTSYSMTSCISTGYQHGVTSTSASQQYTGPGYTMTGPGSLYHCNLGQYFHNNNREPTYSMPDQQLHLALINNNNICSRNRMAHNQPLAPSPSLDRYYNNGFIRPPVTHHGHAQQMQAANQPVACSKIKHVATQTDSVVTEDEIKLIKWLRCKKWDPTKIVKIIQNCEYIVSFEEEKEKAITAAQMSSLISFSDSFKTRFVQEILPGFFTGGNGESPPNEMNENGGMNMEDNRSSPTPAQVRQPMNSPPLFYPGQPIPTVTNMRFFNGPNGFMNPAEMAYTFFCHQLSNPMSQYNQFQNFLQRFPTPSNLKRCR